MLPLLLLAIAQPDPSPIDAAAANLRPNIVVRGEEPDPRSLEELMAETGVPAVSIALVDDNEIVATRVYGFADVEAGIAADAMTRFQAASLSKPVAAMTAMMLAQEGRIDLDMPVNAILTSWQLPEGEFAPVTLRRLLSHRAGTSVSGFPGYAEGMEVPDAVAVLSGKGNTDPVVVENDGSAFDYSGGGYTVAQVAMADRERQPFEDIAARLVLVPLGMDSSSFAQPPRGDAARIAKSHDGAGNPIPGGYNLYPEQAAAGLWTTPRDLATFLIAINRAHVGDEGQPFSPDTVRTMLAPPVEGATYALGFGIRGEGADFQYSHSGSNRGFKSFMTSFPERGEAAVIMTSGDRGAELFRSLMTALADEMGWPGFEPLELVRADWTRAELEALVGGYRLGPAVYRFSMAGEALQLTTPTGDVEPVVPLEDDRIYLPVSGLVVDIERGEDGAVTGVTADGVSLAKVQELMRRAARLISAP